MKRLHARWALTDTGWMPYANVSVDENGLVAAIGSGEPHPAATPVDLLVPGMPNAHCHAFQRGIAGLTERGGGGDPQSGADSFWTWRERMYQALQSMDAQSLGTTALQLYRALRGKGYTSVAEFHYAHRLGGSSPSETAHALVEAAAVAGVRLLLLPVLYRQGGFDGRRLSARQEPFSLSPDAYGSLLHELCGLRGRHPHLSLGIAPHSLRAVGTADLHEILDLRQAIIPGSPVHIHVSEQVAEVEGARQHLGTTPIDWLCHNAPVDRSWVLIHATHATPGELLLVRGRDAVICVCTTTEANLGDGAFDIERWWHLGGSLAIGSDSNVGLDPGEELRWLEYQSRLRRQCRSLLVDERSAHPGTSLWRRAVAGGRQAMGLASTAIGVGAPAELLSLALSDTSLTPDEAMDDLIFAQRVTQIIGAP